MARIHHRLFGIAAAAQQGADPVADLPARHTLADACDLACDLKAQDVGCARGRGVSTASLEQVGPVDARRAHPDQHLSWARNGIGAFGDLQRLGRA